MYTKEVENWLSKLSEKEKQKLAKTFTEISCVTICRDCPFCVTNLDTQKLDCLACMVVEDLELTVVYGLEYNEQDM